MVNKIIGKEGLNLAKKFSPIIYQEVKGIKDFLTPMALAQEGSVIAILPSIFENPTLYYLIQEDNAYWYAFYMTYHPFDWSDSSVSFVRFLDSHKHDTEAVCFKVNKNNEKNIDVATVCHYTIKFAHQDNFKVFIEAKGHGIYPFKDVYLKDTNMYMVYKKCLLYDLAKLEPEQWEKIKKEINSEGAKMPDQIFDWSWFHLVKGNDELIPHDGDLYFHPDKVFSQAEQIGRFKK